MFESLFRLKPLLDSLERLSDKNTVLESCTSRPDDLQIGLEFGAFGT